MCSSIHCSTHYAVCIILQLLYTISRSFHDYLDIHEFYENVLLNERIPVGDKVEFIRVFGNFLTFFILADI
jgi:hypothetical protein